MQQKLITNEGASPMYHGNTMIPPGESRLVEIPGGAPVAEAPAGPSLRDQLVLMLAGSIAVISPQLEGLTNEALDLAYELEGEGGKRKGLLAAIDAERLRRADEHLQQETERELEAAREAAATELADAQVALQKLSPLATDADRAAAQAAVDEAQAKVDALAPDEE